MEIDKTGLQQGSQQLDQTQRADALETLARGVASPGEDAQATPGIFSGLLNHLGKAVAGTQGGAHQAVERFSKGVEGEVHESMMAIEKADISFKFVNTVFKKGIDAYKEVTQRMG